MLLTSGDPSAPLGIVALPDPATRVPGPWIATTRQATTPETSTTDDDLITFGPTAPTTQAQVSDIGALRISQEGDEDAEMSLFAPASGPAVPSPAVNVSAPAAVSGSFTGPNDVMVSSRTVMTGPSGRPQGRNWTGKSVSRVLPGKVRVIETRPGRTPVIVSEEDAPWPDDAYVVAAEGENGRVRLPDGRVLDGEGVAAALAADPELAKLAKDVPVVLVLPDAGDQYQEVLRAVEARLGRKVWGPSGRGRLVADPDAGGHRPVIVDGDANLPFGGWVPFDTPAVRVPFEDREWTALDGTRFRDSDVYSRPLVGEDHERFGRISVQARDDLRGRERLLKAFSTMRRLVHKTLAGDGYRVVGSEEVTPDPAVYVYAAHGKPGRLQLALRDGRTVWLGKRDAARYIAGLREVRELPPGHRVHLEVCWSASDGDPRQQISATQPAPHVDDPLDDVPLGQYAANETRKETTAVTRPTGVDNHGRVVIDAPGGEAGRQVTYRPEPLDHELDQLARDAGLHDGPGAVSPETRATTLRLVRALRRVFGNEIEDHRGVPGGRYERVLKGIAALERMRANDPAINQFTPFRLDMLDLFVREHSGRAPDLAGYVALLDFAAARVAADSDAKLTEAVPAPVVQITLKQLADKGEQVTRYVQSLPAPAAFTQRHMASTLWAMARAAQVFRSMTPAEREEMGRKVLHLGATGAWDGTRQEALWVLTAKAIAEGVDVSDLDLLAAYHLKESGAFGPAALLMQGPNVQGVNWSGTPAPGGVNWGSVRQMTHGPNGTTAQPVQPGWVGPGKPMPMLNVVEVDQAGNIVLHLPGRAPVPVSEDEFLALLELDPALRTVPLGTPVLFLTTGPGALSPQLVQRFSQRTGRPAFGYGAPMMLTGSDSSAPLGILALPDPATRAPGPWTAATRQPTVPGPSNADDGLLAYGVGLEVEERRDMFLSVAGRVTSTLLLARGPGLKFVTDARAFWATADGLLHIQRPQVAPGEPEPIRRKYVIGEFVVEPMAAVPGERRQSPEEALTQLWRARAAARIADERQAAVPLTELLGPLGGWEFTELGRGAKVNPAPEGFDWTAYTQLTLGNPAMGLRDLQEFAFKRLSQPQFQSLIAEGRTFGQVITTAFVHRALGHGDVEGHLMPFLAAVPDVEEVWGYGWLGFQNVGASPVSAIFDKALPEGVDPNLIKNFLSAVSRPALDRVLRALRPRTRTFLDERHDELTTRLLPHLSKVMELYRQKMTPDQSFEAGFFDAAGVDVPTPREHWTAVLTGRTSQGAAVSQHYAVGMNDDDYPTLDTDDGRLAVPLVLMELRHFGYTGQFMTPDEIRRAVAEAIQLSRDTYERALLFPAPLPDDVLREAILRIVNNPVVRGVASFLVVAAGAGVPQVGGPTRKLMTEWDSRTIGLALGRYALGHGLAADNPAHQRLRAAVAEAFALLPRIPQAGQARARAVFEAARVALDILADPAQTPPVLPLVAEIVAVDGSRVLLDRVQVVKHQDADGMQVGVSSRPVGDWQDARRQSYGLLPEVAGYTLVRQGPVPLESPVQPLPFGEAHLVGLRGDASAAALALSDGTDAVFDYARIVDFLFAVDGHLTAASPETAALVSGADLAGPPVGDPLEVPLAGQVLANGMARWVWATGSGLEPVLVPGDGTLGARLQLAEGDWWAGFRPEPSTAELGRLAELVTGERGRAPDVLRWVRAIRLVYGPLLENDTAAFEALLGGFWALERARAANGIQSPLTWGDLRLAIGSYFGAQGQAVPPLPVALQFLLVSAAGSVGVDLELSGLSLVPQHQSVRAWDRTSAQDEEMSLFAPSSGPAAPAPR